MSSPVANDLNRILLGSAIGAAIGLVLLALGVAILWNAVDQRKAPPLATEAKAAPVAAAPPSAAAEVMPYPTVAPAPSTPPAAAPSEPRRPAPSIWRSIFEDAGEGDGPAPPAQATLGEGARPSAARPAPRPAAPRRPPEAQRQDDSLFF